MNLPGFTADGSLYRTDALYRTNGASPHNQRAVYPAQSNRVTDYCLPDPTLSDCYHCTSTDGSGMVVKEWDEGCKTGCLGYEFCWYDVFGCKICAYQYADCSTGVRQDCPPGYVKS